VRLYEAAAVEFERAGDLRVASQTRVSAAYGRIELGSYEEAERALRASMAAADRLGLRYVSGLCRNNLGNVLCRVGALDEALVHEREAVRSFTAQGDQRIGGNSRIYLAGILARSGDLDAALREALAAVELLAVFPKMQAFGLANLARIRLRAGDIEGALSSAGEAMRILEAKGSVEESETLVRLAWAEALEASGDRGAAAQAITAARAQLLEKAARIEDAACRERFLGRVEENARALLLADEWLARGEGAATT
jgi:tetratricopeptide (TPR) repeat protein